MSRPSLLVLAAALVAIPATAAEIDSSQGMAELGGSALIQISSFGGDSTFGVVVAPAFGFFVIDNLQIRGSVQLGVINDAGIYGIGGGAQYFIPTGAMPVYLGGELSYGRLAVSTAFGTIAAEQTALSLLAGVLPPLADNIGLDLGLRVDLFLNDGGGVNVPMGYLGVRAFFGPLGKGK